MIELAVRRRIRATPEKIFAAWTTVESLRQWWGPDGVACGDVELDVRVGGTLRIANVMPDGSVVVITGVYEIVDAPRELAFTWRIDGGPAERVSVSFVRDGDETDVVVVHQKIVDDDARAGHERGWDGCLAGLARYFAGALQ